MPLSLAAKLWFFDLPLILSSVEYAYPASIRSPELDTALPFLALPDGAHLREEDHAYFHLFLPSLSGSTVFGISCNRQILSSSLLNRGANITRSTVQKAVVVLADKPIFGPIRDRLGVITRAYFEQRDFEDRRILEEFYGSLVDGVGGETDLYMGTSLRELIHRFRFKTLTLLKLLLLQKKIMFFSPHLPVEKLCNTQYSLVSLIPSLLSTLDDSASPLLDNVTVRRKRASTLRTSERESLLRFLGMPLDVFGRDSFFQPYLPLQQIDMLASESFVVGTTNSIFQQQRECKIDVLVNIETANIEVYDPKLSIALTLTAADRKWMDELVTTVTESWNPEDPSRPIGSTYVGSDDFLRAKFEEYLCSMLAAIKFVDFLGRGNQGGVGIISGTGAEFDPNLLSSFNDTYINLFRATPAFKIWDGNTDSVLFDLVEPRHPMHGLTNAIEDVGIRLADGLHTLRIDEGAATARDAVTKGFEVGREGVWRAYNGIRSEVARRQAEGAASSGSGGGSEIGSQVIGGVDAAKEKASAVASGIGSFISSRLFVPKAQTSSSNTPTGSRTPSPTRSSFAKSPPPEQVAFAPPHSDSDQYDSQPPSTPSAFSSISSFFSRATSPPASSSATLAPAPLIHRDSANTTISESSHSRDSTGTVAGGISGWWARRTSGASLDSVGKEREEDGNRKGENSLDSLRPEDMKEVAL
ncbi:hypothetical protein BT69DRAFT_1340766 [Atractiella rhizophila]|nr:hypothetical protein BT69DRAFT_1340766 [Atractiella rhizophila]